MFLRSLNLVNNLLNITNDLKVVNIILYFTKLHYLKTFLQQRYLTNTFIFSKPFLRILCSTVYYFKNVFKKL